MKAITLWQPWASWIAMEWKTIETRTHNRFQSLEGQRIAIHAGKRDDRDAERLAWEYLNEDQRYQQEHDFFLRWPPHSVIVCTAFVSGFAPCKPTDAKGALIECTVTQRWGLWLCNIERVQPQVKINGQRGIWTVNAKS